MTTYRKGADVSWTWGKGTARGKIDESFTDEVTRTIKGKAITRKASKDEPAYLIRQEDGDRVLKSHSEIETVS